MSNQLQVMQQELESKSDLLNKYDFNYVEYTSLQKQHQELQDEYKEIIENLMRDKNFYKSQYELAQASENKIKKDLEEVENILKLKTDELEDYKDRIQVNEKIITDMNAENTQLKKEIEIREKDQSRRNNALLQEKMQELQGLKKLVMERDIALETLQTRNIEIENENKQLYDFRTKFIAREREITELQDEILRLTEGLNNRDQLIRNLEEMARQMSDSQSGASSPLSSSNKNQEIHNLQESLKEKDRVIRQMSDDSKSLHQALKTIDRKLKESGNIVELKKKLKDERKLNAELRENLQRLQKEMENFRDASAQRSPDNSDIEDMVQRELNLSIRLDKQLMQVIKNDQEVERLPEEHKRLNEIAKENEMLRRLTDDLEIERDIMKHQIIEYEDRIVQLQTDLAEETKKVVRLDKELELERNTVKFLRKQMDEYRQTTGAELVDHTKLIEFLQSKLKVSLENEKRLCNDLAVMKQQQISLDSQLTCVKKAIEADAANRDSLNIVQEKLQRFVIVFNLFNIFLLL